MRDDTRETFAKARRWLIDECKSCAEVLAGNKSIVFKKIAQRKLAEIYAAIQAIDIAKKTNFRRAAAAGWEITR
jgi:hypothetical protein